MNRLAGEKIERHGAAPFMSRPTSAWSKTPIAEETMQLQLELGKRAERLLGWSIGECSLLRLRESAHCLSSPSRGTFTSRRPLPFQGDAGTQAVPPNPAFHTSSRLKVTTGSRGSPPRQPLMVRLWPSALSRTLGPWAAVVMNCNSRRSHPSVERRRRRLLIVVLSCFEASTNGTNGGENPCITKRSRNARRL